MKKSLLFSILAFTLVCMSFIPNHKFQTKSLKFKTVNGAMLTFEVDPAVGTGPYEYTVEVTGANPSAVSIDVYLDFNGDHTNTLVNVPLSSGYGYLDGTKSFEVVEVELNPYYDLGDPSPYYHY